MLMMLGCPLESIGEAPTPADADLLLLSNHLKILRPSDADDELLSSALAKLPALAGDAWQSSGLVKAPNPLMLIMLGCSAQVKP